MQGLVYDSNTGKWVLGLTPSDERGVYSVYSYELFGKAVLIATVDKGWVEQLQTGKGILSELRYYSELVRWAGATWIELGFSIDEYDEAPENGPVSSCDMSVLMVWSDLLDLVATGAIPVNTLRPSAELVALRDELEGRSDETVS